MFVFCLGRSFVLILFIAPIDDWETEIIILLTDSVLDLTGKPEAMGSQPVQVVSQGVTQLCLRGSSIDVRNLTVEGRLNTNWVHFYRNRKGDSNLQHKDLREMSLSQAEMRRGNFSLNPFLANTQDILFFLEICCAFS